MSDATNHAMAHHLKILLGVAQAEHIVAGLKLRAGQEIGHHALASLHADERMWDAVVKALSPNQSPKPSPAPAKITASKPMPTLEDVRVALASAEQQDLAQRVLGGKEEMLAVAAALENTPWTPSRSGVMGECARVLRELVKT